MNARILVVDDDAAEREGMAELLRLWGYETDNARNGFDALEKMLSFFPDLVIADLHMPLMGGLELLQRLRRQSRLVNSIVITGEATPSEKCQGIALGASAVLEKPVNPAQLRRALARCLRHSRFERLLSPQGLPRRRRSEVSMSRTP
jgi:CheY-like chemotaxis protein